MGNGEDQSKPDADAIARSGRIDDLAGRRIRTVAERRVSIFEQHRVRERPHAPAQKEPREFADAGDMRTAEDDRDPADDGEEPNDRAEQPAFGADSPAAAR